MYVIHKIATGLTFLKKRSLIDSGFSSSLFFFFKEGGEEEKNISGNTQRKASMISDRQLLCHYVALDMILPSKHHGN